MAAWFATFAASKLFRPTLIAGGVLLLALALFLLGRCTGGDHGAGQARQTVRSTNAAYEGANVAIGTIGNGMKRDAALDAGTAATKGAIDHAQTVDDIGRAVAGGLCGQAGHRNDAACKVR